MLEKLKKLLPQNTFSSDPQGLSMPPGMPGGATGIHLEGQNYIEVEGCRGLTTYTENLIGIRIKEGVLKVQGDDLSLKIYLRTRLAVCGKIRCISFEKEGGNDTCS